MRLFLIKGYADDAKDDEHYAHEAQKGYAFMEEEVREY